MVYVIYLYDDWRSKVSLHMDFYGIVTAKTEKLLLGAKIVITHWMK
jgi:hypothetical protein